MMAAFVIILGATVFVTNKFRVCTEKEEGEFRVLHRVLSVWVNMLLIIFNTLGVVFRPRWYLNLILSSLFFIVARSFIISHSDDKDLSKTTYL
jgi:hypothetical protein